MYRTLINPAVKVEVRELVETLKSLRLFSISGDVEEIKVLENLTITEQNGQITISGIEPEEFKEDQFVLDTNHILYYREENNWYDRIKTIDFDMDDGRFLMVEAWI